MSIYDPNPSPPPPRPANRARVEEQLRILLQHERTMPPGRISHFDSHGNEIEGKPE